ncbi:uncharacterized protein LOC129368458 isoform X2 [Poeciliopsis prolifica]|nr:uncharacterized protein LOC129368458 isoform X2 [Poeciliopsis prolifica]XP_054899410.1 uncharacterized protein LOC129368458 isoform X2 [Poeciliopsis prolifica]XP_054899411.1 uncharacterized protein LOC129368458 isoform X2 [Poeciliopsis prolifica]
MRRSPRLQLSGYYNSEGLPTVSYRDYSYKDFREQKSPRYANFGTYSLVDTVPRINMGMDMEMDSDAETIPYIDIDTDSDAETIPYIDMDSDAETIPYVDLDMDSDMESIHYTSFNMTTEARMTAEEESHFENRRRTAISRSFPKIKHGENIFVFFVTCLLIFVLTYLIYAMSFPLEEFPASPFAEDIAFNTYCKGKIIDPIVLKKTLTGSMIMNDYCFPP